jgi:hypothetical protein
MKKVMFAAAAALCVLGLSACGQGDDAKGKGAQAPAAPAVNPIRAAVRERATEGATIELSGRTLTATRTGAGEQGISIRPRTVLLRFTVEGEGARIRVRMGSRIGYLPVGEQNEVVVGPGGANEFDVISSTADTLVVRVTEIFDCRADVSRCPAPEPTEWE